MDDDLERDGIHWDERKNRWLREHRGVCFEQAAVCLASERVLDVTDHPNQERYPGQKIAVIEINGYAYLVPYEYAGGEILLKTMIPSRKATQRLQGREEMKSETVDREEKELLESFERGEWSSMSNRKAEISRLGAAARATLRKNRRINIRLSDRDVIGLQSKAAEEGMPYQTLIASILHKYLTGALWPAEAGWPNQARRRTANPRRVGVR